MKKTIDVGVLTNKLRKIIKSPELPKGFYYGTDTHIVEGTGEFIYCEELPEGIVVGMENGDIIMGTKKERTAVTVRSS